jgi:hypothetical protein
VKAFRRPAPRHHQIMLLLARAYPMPMTVEAIALECGISLRQCYHTVRAMRLAGRAIYLGRWNGGQTGTAAIYGSAFGAFGAAMYSELGGEIDAVAATAVHDAASNRLLHLP